MRKKNEREDVFEFKHSTVLVFVMTLEPMTKNKLRESRVKCERKEIRKRGI